MAKPEHPNIVEFQVTGDCALFSDPIMRVGDEKCSYQVPTYEALKGILSSVYWKPTIHSHPILPAVLQYIRGGTILGDLSECGLVELDEKGIPDKEKALVRWRVAGLEEGNGACWQSPSLFRAFGD